MKKRFLLATIMFLSAGTLAIGATTGKIAGVVRDAATGDPLAATNVMLEGTTLGAAADMEGNYFILNVPPGDYTIRANIIGYAVLAVTDVRVSIDRTTTIDFELAQSVVAGEEVVVVAEREAVRMDVSYSQLNISAETIADVPVAFRLDDFLESQVGVDQDRQGLTIRGGSGQEIAYYMDGMSLRDERMDRPFSGVSKTSIQEVQLITGTFNAEYGNASSGMVHIATKNPGKRFTVSLESRYSPLIGGDDPDHPGLKHFESYVYSDDNWWEYGRYAFNGGAAAEDKDGIGGADFEGWTAWAADNTVGGETLSAAQAFDVWQWQHRSEDENGDVLYNDEVIGTVDGMYKSDPTHELPFNHYGYQGDMVMDLTFGGPIPFTGGKLGFMFSHLRENSLYPFPTSLGGVSKYNTNQLKLIYDLTRNMKLTLSGLYQDRDVFSTGDPYPSSGIDLARLVGSTYEMRNNNETYNRDSDLVPKNIKTTFLNAKWTHTLSPSTFYEVKLSHHQAIFWQVGNARLRNIGNVYQVGPVWLDEAPKGWAYKQGAGSDILGLYNMRGDRASDLSTAKTYTVAADITSQVTINHQIKAGFEFIYKDLYELSGYTQFMEYYTDDDYRLGADGVEGTADDGLKGDQANWHEVQMYTGLGAAYIQDKIEYKGMIMSLGLRLDMHKPNKDWFDRNDMFYPRGNTYWETHLDRYGDNPDTSGYTNYYGEELDTHPTAQIYLSPRFGISHPMGPQSKVFFNYGHFYDLPPQNYMYRYQLGVDEPMENLGNAWLEMPRTIQFEAGWEQAFLGSYVATISGYYKDLSRGVDDTSIRPREGSGYSYSINTRGRDTKGLELSLRKLFGTFTGFINAEYRTGVDLLYGWDRIYHSESPEYLEDQALTDRLRVVRDPFINTRAPGSLRLKLNLALHSPREWGPGPEIAGAKLLGWWDISLLHRFDQGSAFTWNPDGLQSLQGVYNEREKNYNRTDLNIGKRFSAGGANLVVFLEVSNLLNAKNLNDRNWGRLTSREDRGESKAREIAYMEAIIDEGGRVGDITDDENLMPQRLYYFWEELGDIWMGIRFAF